MDVHKRLEEIQIKNIINKYKSGQSLSTISKELGVSKTTLYYHARKACGRKIAASKINRKSMESVGEFIGIFAGDGNFFFRKELHEYVTRIFLSGTEHDYAKHTISLMTRIFGFKPNVYKSKNADCLIITAYRKAVYDLLNEFLSWENNKSYTVCLRKPFSDVEPEFLHGFLRGLFDTDGNVYTPKRKVSFATISKRLAVQADKSLDLFEIPHAMYFLKGKNGRKHLYTISIHASGLRKFEKLVGFSDPSKATKLKKIIGAPTGNFVNEAT